MKISLAFASTHMERATNKTNANQPLKEQWCQQCEPMQQGENNHHAHKRNYNKQQVETLTMKLSHDITAALLATYFTPAVVVARTVRMMNGK